MSDPIMNLILGKVKINPPKTRKQNRFAKKPSAYFNLRNSKLVQITDNAVNCINEIDRIADKLHISVSIIYDEILLSVLNSYPVLPKSKAKIMALNKLQIFCMRAENAFNEASNNWSK